MSKRGRTMRLHGEKKSRKIVSLLIRDGLNCRWCRKPFTLENRPTLDHLAPYKTGGGDGLGNLVLAHAQCNLKRASQVVSEAG